MVKNQALGKNQKIKIDPLDVTRSLGYQTHRLKARKPWSKEEDDLLKSCVNKLLVRFGFENGIDSMKTIEQSNDVCKNMPWDEIATHFDRTVRKPKDIRKRWVSSLDPNLRKGKWTVKEDELLMRSFAQWGPHWLKVSSEIPGRTEDQCAKRYIEVLDPSTKDRLRDWRLEEDLALISKVKLYGTSWRKISLEMESRPSLTCRNRWRKIITMIMRGKASEEITKAVQGTSQSEPHQSLDELRESLRAKLEEMKDEQLPPDGENLKDTNGCPQDPEKPLKLAHHISSNDSSSSSQSESESPEKEDWPTHSTTSKPQQDSNKMGPSYEQEGLSPLHADPSKFPERPQAGLSRDNVAQPTSSYVTGELQQQQILPERRTGPAQMPQELPAADQKAKKTVTNKRKAPSSRMDWGFTLTDEMGGPVSGGLIANSELVQELIQQARRHSLTISIHQHIHNNFGSGHHPLNTTGFPFTDELLGGMPPYGLGDERAQKQHNARPFETDFLGRSPNFSGLVLDQESDPLAIGHHSSQQYPVLSGYTQKPGNGSSIGSRSTPGAELEEIPPHRQYHFNYLSPTLKPHLSSSSLAKSRGMLRPASDSPSSPQHRNKIRKKRRGLLSEESTPMDRFASGGATPKDVDGSNNFGYREKTKTVGTSNTMSSMLEEEDLDFWESLRSLAAVPAANSHNSGREGPLDEYDYLYNFYEEQAGSSRRSTGKSPQMPKASESSASHSNYTNNPESVHRGLPFNPS
ncbi:LAFA_0D17062g1_1 [Lachancea sp. 'fantastica']|nr:LAFA_0D17062g1_1 [Lachancea sp. 'fantastica']